MLIGDSAAEDVSNVFCATAWAKWTLSGIKTAMLWFIQIVVQIGAKCAKHILIYVGCTAEKVN